MEHSEFVRTTLDSHQTRVFLGKQNDLPKSLSHFDRLKLEKSESCRALLSNFAYCWSVAEASGLAFAAEIAEIGIIEVSSRLGIRLEDITEDGARKSRINPTAIA